MLLRHLQIIVVFWQVLLIYSCDIHTVQMLPSSSLVLVFLDSPHVLGFQNVVGKDVELHIAQSLQFDDPDVQTRILVSEVVALVSYEDHVHFLFDYLLEEHVVTTIGTRLYMMKVVNHKEQVGVRVFVEGLEVEHSC